MNGVGVVNLLGRDSDGERRKQDVWQSRRIAQISPAENFIFSMITKYKWPLQSSRTRHSDSDDFSKIERGSTGIYDDEFGVKRLPCNHFLSAMILY